MAGGGVNYLKCQNYKKFVRSLAEHTGLTYDQSKEAYIGLRKMITDDLVKTGQCVIPGVGKFVMREMKERITKINKGRQMVVPVHKYAVFRFFQMFRKHLKEDMDRSQSSSLMEDLKRKEKVKEVAW